VGRVEEILLASLREALFGEENTERTFAQPLSEEAFAQPLSEEAFAELSAEQWEELYRLAARQGVLAIVYDVVSQLPKNLQSLKEPQSQKNLQPPRNLNIQWALGAEAIEKRYKQQLETATQLAELFAEHGIQTLVLKGLAIATFYPRPEHRECGDLDCFLGENYERGNQICEEAGAEVSRDYYKHSHIIYRNLLVENHRFCLPVRGSRRVKELERHLERIATATPPRYIADTKLIIPPPDFNALFLTAHAFNHFLSEGIKLRHVCDWALLLAGEQNNIDWAEFYAWCDRLSMRRFADAMTAIAVRHLGLKITNPAIVFSSEFADRVLDDIIYKNGSLFNKGLSPWRARIKLALNKLSFGWKYHKIYQKSAIVETLRSTTAFFLEKNPKI
jgi:hypothetical protein